jgi:hypothetical protein
MAHVRSLASRGAVFCAETHDAAEYGRERLLAHVSIREVRDALHFWESCAQLGERKSQGQIFQFRHASHLDTKWAEGGVRLHRLRASLLVSSLAAGRCFSLR